jgi:PIN domain nuclease of toxin-antitoxin system
VSEAQSVLADTHIVLWYLQASPRLAESTVKLLDDVVSHNEPILVSAVTLIELRYLAEKGAFTDAEVDAIHAAFQAEGTGFDVVPIDSGVAWAVGRIPRDAVSDPWDRIIAATALVCDAPLVTYDRKLQGLPGLKTRR